jgi:hypothetical protein
MNVKGLRSGGNSMMKPALAAVLAVMMIVASGCGGNGTDPFSPYMGSYAGTWKSDSVGESGTMTLVVQADGQTTGTMTNETQSLADGAVAAQILEDGTISGTSQFPTYRALLITGTVSHDSRGGIVGQVTLHTGGIGQPMTFKLNRN